MTVSTQGLKSRRPYRVAVAPPPHPNHPLMLCEIILLCSHRRLSSPLNAFCSCCCCRTHKTNSFQKAKSFFEGFCDDRVRRGGRAQLIACRIHIQSKNFYNLTYPSLAMPFSSYKSFSAQKDCVCSGEKVKRGKVSHVRDAQHITAECLKLQKSCKRRSDLKCQQIRCWRVW